MKILEKIRSLPEGKRKLIFWILIVIVGLIMITWFALTTIARMNSVLSH